MKPHPLSSGLATLLLVLVSVSLFACASPEETPSPTVLPATLEETAPTPPPAAPATPEVIAEEEQEGPAEQTEAVREETPAVDQAVAMAEPLIQGQGGTCISGYIIDRYHQATGASWKITVTSPDGNSQVRNADSTGRFSFSGLTGGTWTVALEVPGGWQPFTPASFPVTLSGSGGNCAEVRFKVEALACLEVTKFDAQGGMGLQHMVGLPEWKMTATQGSTTLSASTDWQGKLYFQNLAPGTWTVEEESRTGWTPAAGYSNRQTINLSSPHTPGVCQRMTFVNQQIHKGCIRVCKVDGSGNSLHGWSVTVKRDDGVWPSATKATDKSGCATFDGLALGQWTVQEEVKAWWSPAGATEQKVDLAEPGVCTAVTFRNDALGCIDGFKINDLNEGLSGWTIRVRNVDSGKERTTVTDGSGYFKFQGLPLGTWTVSEELQTGWESVTPTEFDVTVNEAFKCQHVRFKNRTSFACVDVYKKDARDGAGLPGWEITLKPAYGGTAVVGTTDGTGHVRFNGLTPGTYVVSEKMQSDWVAVTPQSQQLILEASGVCHVVNFKNRQASDPPYVGKCRLTYRVCYGDTLYSIARRYGTTVAAIKQANGLWSNTIYANQKLCIP